MKDYYAGMKFICFIYCSEQFYEQFYREFYDFIYTLSYVGTQFSVFTEYTVWLSISTIVASSTSLSKKAEAEF